MKVTIANVKYSPNLGDGVIAECFEAALRRALPNAEVKSCDLAGRTAYGTGLNASREWVMRVLDTLPASARRFVVGLLLRRMIASRLNTHYAAALEDSDAVILGGGQLLADTDLNFPLKVQAALRVAKAGGASVSVHGVGVSKTWSPEGHALFADVLAAGLTHAGVRDKSSAVHWAAHFGKPVDAVVRDPGVLAAQTFGPVEKSRTTNPRVGLGIAHPSTLKMHADDPGAQGVAYIDLFAELARRIVSSGRDAILFTNGATDDEAFLARLRARLTDDGASAHGISFAPQSSTPAELSHLIGGFDAVVAHRLHANIVAYAYGVPHVGLGWDSKVGAFFDSVGRGAFALTVEDQTVDAIMAALDAAWDNPVSPDDRAAVIALCEADVASLARRISNRAGEVRVQHEEKQVGRAREV